MTAGGGERGPGGGDPTHGEWCLKGRWSALLTSHSVLHQSVPASRWCLSPAFEKGAMRSGNHPLCAPPVNLQVKRTGDARA